MAMAALMVNGVFGEIRGLGFNGFRAASKMEGEIPC